MKALIVIALFVTGVATAQVKGFESYQPNIVPTDGIATYLMFDSSYVFGTAELNAANTKAILDEMERILGLYGLTLEDTKHTIPEGANWRDAIDPTGVVCLHYDLGDMVLYFGTWNDMDGTFVGFHTEMKP